MNLKAEKSHLDRYRTLATQIRAHALRMTHGGRSGHVGSMLSMAELLAVLYEKILRVDPKNIKALFKRAAIFLSYGDIDQALDDLDRVVRINPRMIPAIGNRAYLLEQTGRYGDAIADLKRILAPDPRNLNAMKHLGYTYRQMGDPDSALQWYQEALKLESDKARIKKLNKEIAELKNTAGRKYSERQ